MWWGVKRRRGGGLSWGGERKGKRVEEREKKDCREKERGRAKEERIGHGREKRMAKGPEAEGRGKRARLCNREERGGFHPLLPKIAFITTNVDKPRPISQLLRAGCQAGL